MIPQCSLLVRHSLRHFVGALVLMASMVSPAFDFSLAEAKKDDRGTFEAVLFAAESVDTFMADDFAAYLNPEDTSDNRTRATGGVQAAIRLDLGRETKQDRLQLWLLADTTYGVRSSDVDCAETDPNKELAICQALDQTNAPARTLYAIREATSLEGGLALRVEYPLWGTEDNMRLYAVGRTSFVAVSEQPDDFLEVNHWAVGVLGASSTYKNSYLEIGRVKNEALRSGETTRYRFDGRLMVPIPKSETFSFFIRTTVEVDYDDGPDSAITSFGFAYDPSELLK